MYEIELKVEITAQEKQDLILKFKDVGFLSKGISMQADYYIQAEKSPHGGYNLKRCRHEDDKYIYTEKVWEMVGDTPARREDEHEISQAEFDSKIKEFPQAIKIQKQRDWFAGKNQNTNINITIDTVKFDHSADARYFIEAEVITDDKTKVKEIKENIREFLKELLGKGEIVESPGMFTMAFEKR